MFLKLESPREGMAILYSKYRGLCASAALIPTRRMSVLYGKNLGFCDSTVLIPTRGEWAFCTVNIEDSVLLQLQSPHGPISITRIVCFYRSNPHRGELPFYTINIEDAVLLQL